MALFTIGSLACGFAQSGAWLIAFRAVQGLGGAIISPATLSIINAAFRHGSAERNKAFGIWGAIAGSGAAAGVLLGGVLTEYAMSQAPDDGWTSLQTIGLTALAVVLVALFLWKERRTDAPLVPLHLFGVRPVLVANIVGACIGGAIFGGFFLLSLTCSRSWGTPRSKPVWRFSRRQGRRSLRRASRGCW